MALDGMLLKLISNELRESLIGAKIDKIYQPEKDMLIINFRTQGKGHKLLISASPSNSRIHFTSVSPENPTSPPMFCMLLRKYLTSGKLLEIRQNGLERYLFFDFECYDDLGDKVIRTLICEIMGKYSNIVLVNEHGKIADCIKHIDFSDSSVRQLLPGMKYTLPPSQNKLDPISSSSDELLLRVTSDMTLQACEGIINAVQGYSPIVCREIVCRCTNGHSDTFLSEMSQYQLDKMKFLLSHISDNPIPVIVIDKKENRPIDFTFTSVTQYGSNCITEERNSFNELVEFAFSERAAVDSKNRKQHDILKILTTAYARTERRLNAQKNELNETQKREVYKKNGDIINANIYRLKKGMAFFEGEDWENGNIIKISLDTALTPSQNAQLWYKKYKKSCNAESVLKQQIDEGEKELAYIDSVFDELTRADSTAALSEVKQELISSGYIRAYGGELRKKTEANSPDEFVSDDGIKILCGKNNNQNDRLTLHTAHGGYIWLHVKNIPGCHTVIFEECRAVPDRTLLQAAVLAATFSKAGNSSNVPVDYTLAKYVKKPSGSKPGMVIYTNQKTLYVSPDKALAERLKKE